MNTNTTATTETTYVTYCGMVMSLEEYKEMREAERN